MSVKSDNEIYRSRGSADAEAYARYVSMLLDDLRGLEKQTDPAKGEPSAAGKDKAAFMALIRANELLNLVAGWALDHVCGLSMSSAKLRSVMSGDIRNSTPFVEDRKQADDHLHELVGGASIASGATELTVDQKRICMRNLLFANAGGWPRGLADELRQAIEALSTGETLPLVQPARSNASKRYRHWVAITELLTFSAFYGVLDNHVTRADEKVSGVACIGLRSFQTWKEQAPEKIGQLEYAERIARAESDAEELKKLRIEYPSAQRNNLDFHWSRRGTDIRTIEDIERRYSEESLQKAASVYLALCKER